MPRTFTIANDERLIELIESARNRLVIVSPGVWKPVAEVIVERLRSEECPEQVSIILDVDPEVCRLGFGDVDSIDLLNDALNERGNQLQRQDGVRIGVVIADEEILIFSPTPQLIEAGSDAEEKPNAIQLSRDAAMALSRACGVNSTGLDAEGNRVESEDSDPHAEQEVGLDFVDAERVEEVKKDLAENPPKQFDLARLERVFNYKLEYVDFKAEHYQLNSKKVPLSAELLGLTDSDLQDRFRNTFRIFERGAPFKFELWQEKTGDKIELTEKYLSDRARKIRLKFFISLGSEAHGNLILKRLKDDFIKEAETLKSLMEAYGEKVREAIEPKIAETRDRLIKDLFPRVKESPPERWIRHTVDGYLSDEDLMSRLEEEVDRAFDKVTKEFDPAVTYLFKGVTYQTIKDDPKFEEGIINYFGETEAEKLLREYEASEGKDPNHSTPAA